MPATYYLTPLGHYQPEAVIVSYPFLLDDHLVIIHNRAA